MYDSSVFWGAIFFTAVVGWAVIELILWVLSKLTFTWG